MEWASRICKYFEVKVGAIYGTDLYVYDDEYPNRLLVILIHEMARVSVAVSNAINRLKVGDRISSEIFKSTYGRYRYC